VGRGGGGGRRAAGQKGRRGHPFPEKERVGGHRSEEERHEREGVGLIAGSGGSATPLRLPEVRGEG